MKVTSVPVVDFLFMIGCAIPYWNINMGTDLFNLCVQMENVFKLIYKVALNTFFLVIN